MTPETIQHIREAGYADSDGKLRRPAMAAAIVPMLIDDAKVVHGPDETERNAKTSTLDEIAHALFGHTGPEHRAVVAQLTGTDSPVQTLLADGVVLCPWRVERPLGVGEASSMRKVAGRFVTDNEEAVNETVLEAKARRVVSAANKAADSYTMAVGRLPGLAAYRPALNAHVQEQVQLALPVPEETT